VISNVIEAFFQALQIIFEMQSQGISQKRSYKENTFLQIAKCVFFHFFSF